MRTRCLCGLTLLVLALHALGWQIACAGLPRYAPPRAGVRWIALVSVAQRAQVPEALPGAMPGRVRAPLEAPSPGPGRASVRTPMLGPARPRVTPAGDAGVRRSAPAPASEWPVYATALPPSTTLRYTLVQGGAPTPTTGDAELEWTQAPGTYSLRVTTAVAEHPPREWQSTGALAAAGVAPTRFVERERGRDRRAINFDRAAGRVRFSGTTGAWPIAAGVQDRWSWIAQLAAIAEADAQRGQVATHWDLQVAGLRGELERWTFRVLPPGDPPAELRRPGNAPSASDDRAPALLHVLRATEQPYDLRIEAWLSPALHHLPAGLRMSTPPGAWSLSLWLRAS